MMINRNKRRVVITGIGMINSSGNGKDQFWKNCLKAKSNIKKIPEKWHDYHDYSSKFWSPLPDIDFVEEGVDPIEMKKTDIVQVLSIIAARQAIEDANMPYALKDRKKRIYALDNNLSDGFGVYTGTGIGGVTSLLEALGNHVLMPLLYNLKNIKKKLNHAPPEIDEVLESIKCLHLFNRFSVPMTMANACSANIGIKYSLTGPNNTYCAACASGTVAIGNAFKAIKNGEVDKAVTGGVEYLGDPYGVIFRAFDVVKTLVKDWDEAETVNRPFDEKRSGFLLSEGGGAMLILEELQHAMRRKAQIYAEITGYAEAFDAYNIMMIDPSAKEIEKMILNLLQKSSLSPPDIDYINAHGTGTKANDAIEAQVIDKIFGKEILINSTKSIIGHTIGASGAIEACVAALSIKNKKTHICKNLDNPIADLNFVRQVTHHDISRAISQSFAFGGHNAAILFEEFKG